ncbi:MAG: response regulator transcription factor [Lachnospiraceae bacterium]|nr:response regulator transcription factor [Lachnospiraceae bacterium]
MYRILIVEDDASIARLIEMNCSLVGYASDVVYTGAEALQRLEEQSYDLAVLDIMLPEIDGFELMPYMKQKDIPVIYVSAKGELEDKICGLRLGAEDYLVKPFHVLELLVRIEKVLARKRPVEDMLEVCDVQIYPREHAVRRNGQWIELKPMEYALLLMFVKHPNVVFSREQLLQEVWGDNYICETRTVDNHVFILRKKLDWAERIVTVHRVGYKLEVR